MDAYNGHIELRNGKYTGELSIEGIDLSPIVGIYFKKDDQYWLWLKRKDIIEYDFETDNYTKRKPKPYWECYLKKTYDTKIAYKGTFVFCHFKFDIYGIWDRNLKEKERLNFIIERSKEQTLINKIKNKNKMYGTNQ
jgi:hypothetical protein